MIYFVWDILKPRIQVSWLWIHFPSRLMFHSDWFSITLCGGRCGQLSLGALGLPCMAACDRHPLRATYFTYNLCSGRSCLFYGSLLLLPFLNIWNPDILSPLNCSVLYYLLSLWCEKHFKSWIMDLAFSTFCFKFLLPFYYLRLPKIFTPLIWHC